MASRTAAGARCGRTAEDGRIPDRYQLRETDSPDYAFRTEQNVLDSDATLILYRGQISGGSELTLRLARQHGRPHLVVNLDAALDPADVRRWLEKHAVETLNVAGPRESQSPGIGVMARDFMRSVLYRRRSKRLPSFERGGTGGEGTGNCKLQMQIAKLLASDPQYLIPNPSSPAHPALSRRERRTISRGRMIGLAVKPTRRNARVSQPRMMRTIPSGSSSSAVGGWIGPITNITMAASAANCRTAFHFQMTRNRAANSRNLAILWAFRRSKA